MSCITQTMPLSRVDWTQLPECILQRVLCSLPSPGETASRLVCKLWRDSRPVQSLKSSKLTNRQLSSICNNYPDLTSIDLGGSRALTASSLRPLSRLSKLTALCLHNSKGMGDVGEKSLAGLEGLLGLERLDLSCTAGCASAAVRVGCLQGLTFLDISGDVFPFGVGQFENQLSPLKNLTNLRTMCFRGYNRSGALDALPLCGVIEALPYLSEVDFSFANVNGRVLHGQVLGAFQKHKVLRALKLYSCGTLTRLEGLEDLPHLASLNLDGSLTHVGDPCLRRLPALTALKVNMGRLPSEHSLSGLTALIELTLLGVVYMTEGVCSELLQLPHLRTLGISCRYSRTYIDLRWTSRLTTHPGLARISWSQLERDLFESWKLKRPRVVDVPACDGWVMIAVRREDLFDECRLSNHNICLEANIDDLADYVASPYNKDRYFDLIYTRTDQ